MEMVVILAVYFHLAAWVFDAGMDKLLFHYDRSVFSTLKNQQFWNPKLSYKNKWKHRPDGSPVLDERRQRVERFWGSSRWFVALTDGWHLLQLCQLSCFTLSFALLLSTKLQLSTSLGAGCAFLVLRLAGGSIWVVVYNTILKLKK